MLKLLAEKFPQWKKYGANTAFLLAEKFARLILGFMIGIWVARYLQPERFGVLNYAISFIMMFSPFIALGLDNILVRDLVKEEGESETVSAALGMKFLSGITGIGAIEICALIFSREEAQLLILILGVHFIFRTFNVFEFFFQARLKSSLVVAANLSGLVLAAGFRVAAILLQADLVWFAVAFTLEITISALVITVLFLRRHPIRLQMDLHRVKELLQQGWPLMLSAFAIAVYMRIDQLMLFHMLGKKATGVYSAAVRVSELWYMIPAVITSSLLPSIIRSRELSEEHFRRRMQYLFDALFWSAITVAAVFQFGAAFTVSILFGDKYNGAADILTIHIWSSVFVFSGMAAGNWLLAENLQRILFFGTLAGACLNAGLNWVMIPRWGGSGAAVATLLSQFVSSWLIFAFFRPTWPVFSSMVKSIYSPVLKLFRYILIFLRK